MTPIFDNIKYIKIFLASADDVKKERDLLENVLREENELHYKKQGYLFDFVRWEKDSPVDNRPWQESLNTLIDKCAIFIMLAWLKLGKGTKDECRYAITRQNKKGSPQILLFHNMEPPEEGTNQIDKELDEFLDTLRKEHPQVRVFKYKIEANIPDYEKLDFIFKKNISNWFYLAKSEDKLEKSSIGPEEHIVAVDKFREFNRGF